MYTLLQYITFTIVEYLFLPFGAIFISFVVKKKLIYIRKKKLDINEFMEDIFIDIQVVTLLTLVLFALNNYAHELVKDGSHREIHALFPKAVVETDEWYTNFLLWGIYLALFMVILFFKEYFWDTRKEQYITSDHFFSLNIKKAILKYPTVFIITLIAFVSFGIAHKYQMIYKKSFFPICLDSFITILGWLALILIFSLLLFKLFNYFLKNYYNNIPESKVYTPLSKNFVSHRQEYIHNINKLSYMLASTGKIKKEDDIYIYSGLIENYDALGDAANAINMNNELINLYKNESINRNKANILGAVINKIKLMVKYDQRKEFISIELDEIRRLFPENVRALAFMQEMAQKGFI